MNGAPDVSAGQERERVAGVDCERAVLGLYPLPLARLGELDLKRGHGLAEEQSPGAEVGMSTAPEATELLVLLRGVLRVLHVAEVILRERCQLVALIIAQKEDDGPRSCARTDECW